MKRYDAITRNYSGGFDWSPDDIKECEDGELVKYDEAQAIINRLETRLKGLDNKYEWLESNSTLNDFTEPYND